jgi:hypothetical protein
MIRIGFYLLNKLIINNLDHKTLDQMTHWWILSNASGADDNSSLQFLSEDRSWGNTLKLNQWASRTRHKEGKLQINILHEHRRKPLNKILANQIQQCICLNVSPKFMCWKLNPPCNHVERWDLRGGVWIMRFNVIVSRASLSRKHVWPFALSLVLHLTMWCLLPQPEGPHQLWPLDLGLPSLQDYEPSKFLNTINYSVCGSLLQQHKTDSNNTMRVIHTLWPFGIYSRYERMGQHLQLIVIHHINGLRKTNHTVLAVGAGKTFDKTDTHSWPNS